MMTNNVNIHFKWEDMLYSMVMMKKSVEEITLSMVKERIYKKLALDEREVKLQLSYNPLLVGCADKSTIKDDEEMYVFLTTLDHENRGCVLFVEVITTSGLPVQQSKAVKSSFGMNYDKSSEEEVGANAITLYVGKEKEKEQLEVIEEDDGADRTQEGGIDEGMDREMNMGDVYAEPPPIVEPVKAKEPWEDGLGLKLLQEFRNKRELQDVVGKAAYVNSWGFDIKKSEPGRLVLRCNKEGCKWRLRGTRVKNTDIFSIRRYTNMHNCSRASESKSSSSIRRHGTPDLVAALLREDYPGQTETPCPKVIMELVKTRLGVSVSYSTALRGKNKAIDNLRGSSEESYKMLYCYLHMLEKVNIGTVTSVKLDEKGKFKNLFIALGANVEGFQVMRKVIIMDATFLKNGYGGVLVFASAQDPNHHTYPIAFGVLHDGEKDESWHWFLEMLKTVVGDSSEIVFMTDRNQSLIKAIRNVYPQAYHGYCIWHLSQNVKCHASNVNRDVVAWRFIECSKHYTVAEFNEAYDSFKTRYPSVASYVEVSTKKEKWARAYFPGERYNLDTSNAVESLNKVFKEERRYALIPLLDAIIKKLSTWFNEHRQEAMAGSIANKMVPLVENCMHDSWVVAEKLNVTALNTFELEYNVIDTDGKHYLVNLVKKRCSCRVFDIEKYPCLHGLAAYIKFHLTDARLELHELCSPYYWSENWTMAYYRTIYLVPNQDQWDVPDDIKRMEIIPPDKKKNKGRRRVIRFPSQGERRRPRTQNKRRKRQRLQWLLFGQSDTV